MSTETHEQKKERSEVQESNFFSLDKSTKSSVNVGSTRLETSYHKVKGSKLLDSVEPPDLASVERSETRDSKSVSRRLLVISEFPFTQQQLYNLFNIIPGLESCEIYRGLHSDHAYAFVQYNNTASAIYAKHKLHCFEYPFGSCLSVTFSEGGTDQINLLRPTAKQMSSMVRNNCSSFQLLGSSESQRSSPYLQTDADLPSSKRKAPPDSSVRERLFIMFNPCPLPQDILNDVLSRFGNFINAYLIPGENVAYATFAERGSASDAIAVLHGRTVNGVKLTVKLADLPTEDSSKRKRTFWPNV